MKVVVVVIRKTQMGNMIAGAKYIVEVYDADRIYVPETRFLSLTATEILARAQWLAIEYDAKIESLI